MKTQSWVEQEFDSTKLPDERYRANLYKMVTRLSERPEASFSSACGELVRKAAWRLFSSSELDLSGGHEAATLSRCKAEQVILVVEDTTDLNYWNHKQTEGLGLLGGQKTVLGLCVHSALALNEAGDPLGLVGEHIWPPKTDKEKRKAPGKFDITEKESNKWLLALGWIDRMFKDFSGTVIAIGDREADIYEHFTASRGHNVQLLVRIRDVRRKVEFEGQSCNVKELATNMPLYGYLEVTIRRQKDREERLAKLAVRYGPVTCLVPQKKKGEPVAMWVIHVKEVGVKDGITPIEWYLFTTLPVTSLADAIRIIEYYSKRWTIERFHYVLKQGLRIERLQFDNYKRLTNAIQLYLIIGWYLLRLAYVAKVSPDKSASEYFDELDIKLVEQFANKKVDTVKQYIIALSSIAGFVPSKKQPLPGEKLLWQSIRTLVAMRAGFLMAQNYGTG
ncbi:MAG: IS4 family transposase [Saprospiraceae bacterium]